MAAGEILVLSESDVRAVLNLDLALQSQRDAFQSLGRSEARLPPRLTIDGSAGSVAFCYAARLGERRAAVSKFGSFNPDNGRLGLASVSAVVMVLDPLTGAPTALMDGTSVTELRTSAASAVAAEALAPHAGVLAVLGSGVQAAAHIRAMDRTHQLDEIRLWARNASRVQEIAAELSAELERRVGVAASAESAVAGADLIALCTASATPVIESDWVDAGATVISIGSFEAHRHEVPAALVDRAVTVVVDDVPTALEFAGPVVEAVATGRLTPPDLVPLGRVLVTSQPVRDEPSDVVYYNSVGIGAQDAAAAEAIVSAARSAGVGRPIVL